MRLDGQLAADEVAGWLSGLLIDESALCVHYRHALAEFSLTDDIGVDSTRASGLWQIAVRAGLVASGRDIQ